MSKIDLSKTAQERHARALSRALRRMAKRTPEERAESRQHLEVLLAAKEEQNTSRASDPIENAMRNHPGLTRETAETYAEAFGF